MSKQLFSLLVCAWTAIGIGISAAASQYSADWHLSGWGTLGLVVVMFAGIFIAASENIAVRLLGYLILTVTMGLFLGPFVALYTSASVFKALFITTAMVVILGVIGATIPDSLDSWYGWLMGALIMLILGLLFVPLASWLGLPVDGALTVLDWVGLVIFGALVIFDLNRAMRIPYTMENSIGCALNIYLDFVNIFIRILSLTGNKASD